MRFGPTFYDELVAAGLGSAQFAVNQDGEFTWIKDDVTPEQVEQIRAVIAAHDPTKTKPAPKSDIEKLVEALAAEGVIPNFKPERILARIRA